MKVLQVTGITHIVKKNIVILEDNFFVLTTAKGLISSCSMRVVEHAFQSFLRFTTFMQRLSYTLRIELVSTSISSDDRVNFGIHIGNMTLKPVQGIECMHNYQVIM